MASQRESNIQEWLEGLDEDSRRQAEYLVNIVEGGDTRFEQAVKWGRLVFTVGGNWHHWICGIAATKKGVTLVFHKGVLLDDPHGLLAGSGRYVREVPAQEARRHPDAIGALLGSAVTHQTDMLG
jgi:hypothetical protein